jgi:hypothetical protein
MLLPMTMTVFYSILFVLGLVFIFFRPLAKLLGIQPYWEIGAGALFSIAFVFHLTTIFVMEPAMEEELAKKPCGESSPQGRCYTLEKSLCETAWQGAEAQCKTELAQFIKEHPSGLIGPALNRCRARKMDQVLKFNRTNTESDYCRAYFEAIQGK